MMASSVEPATIPASTCTTLDECTSYQGTPTQVVPSSEERLCAAGEVAYSSSLFLHHHVCHVFSFSLASSLFREG